MKKRFFYVAILSLLSLVSFGQGGFTPIPKLKITTTPETNNSTTEVLVRDATTGNVGKVAKSSLAGTLDSVTDAGANTTNAISTGGVGINTTTPQALFDVVSTSSGILIPRLTTSQRDAIVSPSTSELIYNSTNGRFEFFNGIDWTFIGGSTSTPTLQEVTDEGATTTNTIEIDIDEGDAIILKSGGNNVGLISTTNGGVDFITNDVLGENATQYRNGNIEVNKNSGSPKTYQLPTNEDGTFDLVAIIVNANKTAENDGNYSVVANATFTDPTPAEGKGYMVTVINGAATIGGVGYTVGQKVFRHYHSGSWRTFVYKDSSILDYKTTETQTGGKWIDGKPIYRKVIEYTFDSSGLGVSIAHGISDLETVVDGTIIDFQGGGTYIYKVGANSAYGDTYTTTTNVEIENINAITDTTINIILEYTKTTD
jgi:hypothetical protein